MAFFSSQRQPAPAMTLEGVLGPNSQLDDAAGFPAPSPEALFLEAVEAVMTDCNVGDQQFAEFCLPFTRE